MIRISCAAPPSPEAVAALAALHAAAFADARAAGAPWSAAALAASARDPWTVWALAEAPGAPAGFACLRWTGPEAELLTVARDPGFAGERLGLRLICLALNAVYRVGVDQVFLEVGIENAPARQVYREIGFECVGRRPRYYRNADGSRQDALILSKLLTKH